MSSHPYPSLAALVADKAETQPDLPILTFVAVQDDGTLAHERRSYRALHENAQALAHTLRGLGVVPGSMFAIMMQNHPEFVEAMLAASILGACFVPIDPRTMGDKLDFMLRFAECQGIIATPEALAVVDSTQAGAALPWRLALGPDYAAAIAEPPAALDWAKPRPEAPFFMMFTSGTTGNPKAVVQAQGKYMAAATGMRAFGITQADTFYTGLSLTHINAQGTLRTGLALSAPVVFSRKFTKTRLWEICRTYGCTVFSLLGGMIPEIYSLPETPQDANNKVRLIISAGMPPHLWTAYQKRFGVEICEVYGATEGGGALFNPPGAGPVGSIGKPPKGLEAMVFREDATPCGPNEPGELCFRPAQGAAQPAAYFKNAAAGAQKLRDGWFLTGDIAHYDAEGWFYFDYRKGGGVRRNGDFVNTGLVEAVIVRSGLVADVFVYGVPLPQNVSGEKTLVSAVVLAPQATKRSLQDFCRANLEKNDVPEIFQILPEIPKTISEKPIERACIDLLLSQGPQA